MLRGFDPTEMEDDVRRLRAGPDLSYVKGDALEAMKKYKDSEVDWPIEAVRMKTEAEIREQGFFTCELVTAMPDTMAAFVTARVCQAVEEPGDITA